MLARTSRKMDEKDGGFTLIELLVVMIIIGILAAIAIPVFLSQRAKAQDSAAKSDVSTIGKEIATYFVDNTAVPTSLAIASGRYVLSIPANAATGAAASTVDIGKASTNVTMKTNTTAGWKADAWCVGVENLSGSQKTFRYSAQNGLEPGVCASATSPT